MSLSDIRKPTRRVCEQCGRTERWDETAENWAIENSNVGRPFCIHEWDINGTFNPVSDA